MKVLCVSPRFAPVNAADSHRVRLVVPHLLAQGCHVEVLTVDPGDVDGPQDAELAARLPAGLKVHRVSAWHTSGWGLNGLAQRSFVALYRKGCELLANGHFDLVFFSTTEFLLHALGPLWQRTCGVPFCMDIQDPWVNDYYHDNPLVRPPGGRLKHGLADRLHRLTESFVVPRCAGFLSVSPAYLPMLEKRHGAALAGKPRKVAAFPGEPDEFSGIDCPAPRQTSGRVWRYVGRGGPDMARAASAFFLAWRQSIDAGLVAQNEARFEALGTSYATGRAAVHTYRPLAEQAGMGALVAESPGRLGYVETLCTLRASDALVVFGSDDSSYTASKIYPYLLCGKPLLAIFHEQSSVVALMRSVAGGICVPFNDAMSTQALAAAIRAAWFEARRFESAVPLDSLAFRPHTAEAQAVELRAWFEEVVAHGR